VNLAKQGQASRQLLAQESWCWKYIFFEMTEERTSESVPRVPNKVEQKRIATLNNAF
jgi:hypothetical protein